MASIMIEASIGEVIDKITILQIKAERIEDAGKVAEVQKELKSLTQTVKNNVAESTELTHLTKELKTINETLWEIEDDIRECERQSSFGDQFISLARSVYITNDKRAELKRKINSLTGSEFTEVKSYSHYQ